MVGTDTSHAPAFARCLLQSGGVPGLAGARVTDAVPGFSADIVPSVSRHAAFEQELEELLGVTLHGSVAAMAGCVDAFLLLSSDGRRHPAQLRELLPFGKPVFVDKPFAVSLRDAAAMFGEAAAAGVPVFSASLNRFRPSLQRVMGHGVGRILHVDSRGPCHREPTHPDLFWYGIHPAEALFTVLGPECGSVVRVVGECAEVVTGLWRSGAVGTLTGFRAGPMPYGVTIHGEEGTAVQEAASSTAFGAPEDYTPLVLEIVRFFRTGLPPVEPRETLALMAFLEAASGPPGVWVRLPSC